jgi:hypothetical protein
VAQKCTKMSRQGIDAVEPGGIESVGYRWGKFGNFKSDVLTKNNSLENMKKFWMVLSVAGLLVAPSLFASVTYQINNGGLESFNLGIDGNSFNGALAGGILINRVSGDLSMPSSYVTVCTDIGGTLYLGQQYTYNTPQIPFSGQSGINPNWGDGSNDGSAAKAIQNAAYLFYTYGQLTSTGLGGTTQERAALQLAVWAALYNTTVLGTVTGTRFTVSSGDAAAIALANTWLTGLTGSSSFPGYLLYPSQLTGVNADGMPPQELLIGSAIPESPTVIAGALLLLPFAASTLRIFRKKQVTKA